MGCLAHRQLQQSWRQPPSCWRKYRWAGGQSARRGDKGYTVRHPDNHPLGSQGANSSFYDIFHLRLHHFSRKVMNENAFSFITYSVSIRSPPPPSLRAHILHHSPHTPSHILHRAHNTDAPPSRRLRRPPPMVPHVGRRERASTARPNLLHTHIHTHTHAHGCARAQAKAEAQALTHSHKAARTRFS